MRVVLILTVILAFCHQPALAGQSRSPIRGISSGFGWRIDPINGHNRFHGGIDIPAKTGTQIYATEAGYVVYSGWYGGYGKLVAIAHRNSLFTLYGHASRLYVRRGQYVRKNQVIATVGSTGHTTGPHLHFEVHRKGQFEDPMYYLRQCTYNHIVSW